MMNTFHIRPWMMGVTVTGILISWYLGGRLLLSLAQTII